jgi:hypothetical protein
MGEQITSHGTHKIQWLVHLQGRWTSLRDVEGALFENLSAGPGTVWQIRAELALHVGTWLQCVESVPLPQRFTDPMRYLERETRGARQHTKRRYFTVQRDGRLKPAASSESPE